MLTASHAKDVDRQSSAVLTVTASEPMRAHHLATRAGVVLIGVEMRL